MSSCCTAVDDLTGAACTLELPHDDPHKDESDWGCIIAFRDVAKLIVPSAGTEILNFQDAIVNLPYFGPPG